MDFFTFQIKQRIQIRSVFCELYALLLYEVIYLMERITNSRNKAT